MHAATLIDALKRMLKGAGLTYADLARGLAMSEAGVKRMFSRGDFTLQRLDEICRIAGIDFADLARVVATDTAGSAHLTLAQEREIVSDPKLMLVALCAVNNWTFEQIVDTYALTKPDCIRCLSRLDRVRVIELLPGNRIRPLISRTFTWLPDGPIQRYFRAQVEAEFLGSAFDRPGEMFLFASGMLSGASTTALAAKLRKVVREFAELHRDDLALPLKDRFGTSLLVASRPWEPRAFLALRRDDRAPVPAGRLQHPPLGEKRSPKSGKR